MVQICVSLLATRIIIVGSAFIQQSENPRIDYAETEALFIKLRLQQHLTSDLLLSLQDVVLFANELLHLFCRVSIKKLNMAL